MHHECEPLTEENVLNHLKEDLEFAFEKALDCRGISANFMWNIVRMWLYILDDNDLLEKYKGTPGYKYYGLPLLKAVAIKYNLPNPIGDDTGAEEKYSGGF